jgi:hypothetical protein
MQLKYSTRKKSVEKHIHVAKQGGTIALNARMDLEAKIGHQVVSPLNSKSILSIDKEDSPRANQ